MVLEAKEKNDFAAVPAAQERQRQSKAERQRQYRVVTAMGIAATTINSSSTNK
jgi:hypothetical protein